MRPQVSVIVPAYGVADLLGEALASLQAQTLTDWEAIVVDDGATDEVAAAFAPFAGDSRMRLLQTDNGGPARARNRAIVVAKSSIVALLDGDDAYAPAYLATMVAALRGDPSIGLVTCDATYIGDADRIGRRFSDYYPQAGAITLERVLRREVNLFIGCTIRHEALASVGGFDESLSNAEDYDLWLRLLGAGWRSRAVAEPLVRYRRRVASRSSNRAELLAGERQVYRNAVDRLSAGDEREAALEMLARVEAEQRWLAGERLIMAGQARQGVDLLKQAHKRSRRWRAAIAVMDAIPALARPLLRVRR